MIWVVKLDENRNIIWDKTYGGTGVDRSHHIQTTDGGYLIGGSDLIFQAKRPIIHAEILIWTLKLTNLKYNVAKKHLRQQFDWVQF
jgi:hypothetical protein